MHLGRSTKNFRVHESTHSWIKNDPSALEEIILALGEPQQTSSVTLKSRKPTN